MKTENFSIRMTPATAKALKVLAAQVGATQGELLKAFTYLAKVRHISIGDLAQAVAVAAQIPEPGFVGDDRAKHIEYLDRVAHLAHAAGDPDFEDDSHRCAYHFRRKAQAVAAGEPALSPEAVVALVKAVVRRDEERPLILGDDMTEATGVMLEATSPAVEMSAEG